MIFKLRDYEEVEKQAITHIDIYKYVVDLQSDRITVMFTKGYFTEIGKYIPVDYCDFSLVGVDVQNIMTGNADTNKNRGVDIVCTIANKMDSHGKVAIVI